MRISILSVLLLHEESKYSSKKAFPRITHIHVLVLVIQRIDDVVEAANIRYQIHQPNAYEEERISSWV